MPRPHTVNDYSQSLTRLLHNQGVPLFNVKLPLFAKLSWGYIKYYPTYKNQLKCGSCVQVANNFTSYFYSLTTLMEDNIYMNVLEHLFR